MLTTHFGVLHARQRFATCLDVVRESRAGGEVVQRAHEIASANNAARQLCNRDDVDRFDHAKTA